MNRPLSKVCFNSHILSLCLSVYVSICLSVYVSVCFSVNLSLNLSLIFVPVFHERWPSKKCFHSHFLSLCLYRYVSICLFVSLLCFNLSCYLSVYVSICPSLCLFFPLSPSLSIRISGTGFIFVVVKHGLDLFVSLSVSLFLSMILFLFCL